MKIQYKYFLHEIRFKTTSGYTFFTVLRKLSVIKKCNIITLAHKFYVFEIAMNDFRFYSQIFIE